MKVIVTKNYDEMSEKAFEIIKEIILNKNDATLGLATGSSPVGIYKCMVKEFNEGKLSFKNVKSVNLDEYVGQGVGDEQSYVEFMKEHLFNLVDIDMNNTDLPCGMAQDVIAECERYNKMLNSTLIDVQILGIGSNAHIGFNEPNTPFDSVTHVVNLTKETILDNARFFNTIEEVPTQAISMGISNIMNAKSIILVACGKNKAQAIKNVVEGEITPSVPGSVLQNHPNVTIITDEDAGSLLSK